MPQWDWLVPAGPALVVIYDFIDRSTCETVELIILLAHKLKFKVIAEGIETSRQLDQLLALECDLGQGYLFSRPVDPKAVEELLCKQSPLPKARVAKAQ